ncbi:hypothetical protein FRC02_006137, partial [Tulasnella sp. 418]
MVKEATPAKAHRESVICEDGVEKADPHHITVGPAMGSHVKVLRKGLGILVKLCTIDVTVAIADLTVGSKTGAVSTKPEDNLTSGIGMG